MLLSEAHAVAHREAAPRLWQVPAPLPQDLPRRRTKLRVAMSIAGSAADLALLTLSLALTSLLHLANVPTGSFLSLAVPTVAAYVIFAINDGALRPEALLHPRVGVPRAVWALICAVGAMLAFAFALQRTSDYSRLTLGLGVVVAMVALPLARHLLARAIWRVAGGDVLSTVVIRDGAAFTPVPGEYLIEAERYGLVPDSANPRVMDWLGQVADRADRVVVACAPERRALWAVALKGMNTDVQVLVPELESLGPLALAHHGTAPTAQVACASLSLSARILKRAFDLAVTLAVMPVLLPVMIAAAIAVKLDSPGPILFRQSRIGLGNRQFTLFKFRSMRAERSDREGNTSTARDDDRVTRVGRFIRRTSIDELPQLLNVLNGSMSLVGPRPHAAASTAEDNFFWAIDPRYWDRHAMKPGLTGLAQVRGFRGATHSRSDVLNRVQADLEYLSHWTLFTDLRILLATVRVLTHRNAF